MHADSQALWAFKFESSRDQPPLPGPDPEGRLRSYGGQPIVASRRGGSDLTLGAPADVVSLAEGAHAAFPEVPLLGVDIVRDAVSGHLYVLEVNACGYVWALSSERGRQMQQRGSFRLEEQFGAIELAAEVLVRETRRRAR